MYQRGIPTIERFQNKVKKTKYCWLWTSYLDKCGYGHFKLNQKTEQAHRVSYRLYVGEIPEGMCVCHKCDTPDCVNPNHLFIGTQLDNVEDREKKGRGGRADGEKAGSAKLTDKEVLEIRRKYKPYKYQAKTLAEEYGVRLRTIRKILCRKTWKHI